MPIFRTPYTGLLNIPGCVLWLDGKDPNGTRVTPSTGATVSTWVDKSVSAKHGASTGTPTYVAGGGVNFDGSSYFLNQTFSQNLSQRSIFIVFQETTNTQFAGVLTIIPTPNSGNDQSSTNGLSSETTSNSLFFIGNFPGYQSQIGSGNPLPKAIYHDSMNGTIGSGYFNGTNATNVTASYTAGTCSGYGLGGRWQGGSMSGLYRLNGVIYEILFFNRLLETAERRQIEGYLAQKWSLTGSLPAGHPGLGTTINNIIQLSRLPYYKVFNPQTISSLVLWLDAADSSTVTGTSPITAWTDKSSAGRTVIITSGPTYGTTTRNGLKTMYFNDNVISSSIASAVGTGDFTLIAVWYQSSAGTNTVLSLGTVASSSQSLGYSGNKYNFYQYGSLESAYSTGPGWVVQVGTRISSIKRLYITGTIGSVPASDSFNVTDTTVTIGKGDNFAITGEIAEIMVYTGTMSDTNRQLLEGYLAQKWGLTGSLVAGHPSLTVPVGAPATGVGKQTISFFPRAATSSPITSTVLNTIATYLRDYMSEFRNPSFFGYKLDGNSYFITDGGNDMYDGGNYTYPWLIAGTQFTGATGATQQAFSINYASTTATTVDTDFVYVSLGYTQSSVIEILSIHPLTVLGFRTSTGTPVGFQLAGNSGADSAGTLSSGILYAGDIIQGFTVHAFLRETYAATDPSHCNLFILLGHPSWGSVFGTISSFADPVANGGNGCYFFTSGAGVSNILAIQTLLSKASGALVTGAECQTVVQAFVNRVKLAVGF